MIRVFRALCGINRDRRVAWCGPVSIGELLLTHRTFAVGIAWTPSTAWTQGGARVELFLGVARIIVLLPPYRPPA